MTSPKVEIRRHAMLHYFNQHLYEQGLISEQARNQLKLSIQTRYGLKNKARPPSSRSSAS